jgi:D-alanyl-D-alanine endopeptidase (penicillin-binding protein 7)
MLNISTRPCARLIALAGALLWFGAALPVDAATRAAQQSSQSGVAKSTKRPASRTARVGKAPRRKAPRAIKRASSRRYSSSRAALRRARLLKAQALQRAMQELAMPRYKVDDSGSIVPDIRAEAAVVYNPITHEILWAENENQERSIASITKVMTAVVFLENETDLAREIAVDPVDLRRASVTYLRRGDRMTASDLLHLLLIASDNAAARTLARASSLGAENFIARMNSKAVELGLTSTHYADPSGLDANNVSSAYDMARLIVFATSDERIAPIMRTANYTVSTKRRTISIHNTNRLVGSEVDVRGGKTGFISKAGYCLATLLKLPQSEDQVAVVVLGARSNAARFWETRHIFNWLASKTSQVVVGSGKTYE